jgi:dephospho-CoA kinase
MLKARGIPVWDADAAVHQLMEESEELIQAITTLFPEVYHQGMIQRPLLRQIVFTHLDLLQQLETLIYPHLYPLVIEFISLQKAKTLPLCCLEIPLLFETGWQKLCTHVIVTVVPLFVEKERLRRRGLTEEEITGMLTRQWSTERKVALADYCIDTNGPKETTLQQLLKILEKIAHA